VDRGHAHRPPKKLEAAALFWVRGCGENDKAIDDASVLGATPESIAALHGEKEESFEIDPENWDAFTAFLSVATQWAMASHGGPTGLDYQRVKAGLEMAGVDVTPELFGKLRVIERAALNAMNGKQGEE